MEDQELFLFPERFRDKHGQRMKCEGNALTVYNKVKRIRKWAVKNYSCSQED